MFETFRNAWKIEDLRKRILYTLVIIVIFRAGCAIPVPYIDPSVLSGAFGSADMLSYLNMLSGGALCSVRALCSGRFPLHQRLHHHSASDCGHPPAGSHGPGG